MYSLEQKKISDKKNGVDYILSKDSPGSGLSPLSGLEQNVGAYNRFIEKSGKLIENELEVLLSLDGFGMASDVGCRLYYLRDLHNNVRIPFILIEIHCIRIVFIANYFKKPKTNSKESKEFEKSCSELADALDWINSKGKNHEELQEFFKTIS